MGFRLVDGKLVSDDDMPLGESMSEAPDAVFQSAEPPAITFGDNEPLCEVCGDPIPYSGRGRKPKYHPEHRPTAPNRSASTPNRNATLRNETALRAALLERYMQLGVLATFAHPAYGAGIRQKAQAAVDADIEYAKVSPTFRRTLESFVEKSALGVVIAVHAQMLAPIVIGERAKAARKGALRQAQRQAQGQAQGQPPMREAQSTQAPSRPRPTVVPDATVTDLYPSQESDVAAETINAAAMPGMPG